MQQLPIAAFTSIYVNAHLAEGADQVTPNQFMAFPLENSTTPSKSMAEIEAARDAEQYRQIVTMITLAEQAAVAKQNGVRKSSSQDQR